MMRVGIAALCAVLALCLGGVAGAATIEQPLQNQRLAIQGFEPIGQSFTAEDQHVKVAFSYLVMNDPLPDSTLQMDLYSGAGFGGTLLKSVLFSLPNTIPVGSAQAGDFVDVDLSDVLLTVGGVYTAAVSVTGSSFRYGLSQQVADAYAGGQAIYGASGACVSGSCDLRFRITPVAVSAVPLPAGLPLLASGIAALGLWRRRKPA